MQKIFPEVACGLEDPRISMYYDDGLRFLRGKMMNTIWSSTIQQIHWGIRKDFLQKNFTEAVIKLSGRTESWCISMEARFMTRMRLNAGKCTEKSTSHSRSAGYTRHISRPVLPGTGYSDSLLKSIIRWMILMQKDGMHLEWKHGTILQIYTGGHLCFQNM